MTDSDTPEQSGDERPKVDVADLKARLGLKRGETGSDEEVARARSRAERALTPTGSAAESESEEEIDKTPLPQALPQPGGAGGFGYAAQARSNKMRQLLAAGVTVAVGLGLGSLLGSMLEQRDQLASYVRTVDAKLTWMSEFKTESGSTIIEEIELVRTALSTTMTKIEAVEGKGGDPMKLQDSFDSVLMPALEGLRRNKAFFASTRVSDDIQVLYADDVLLKAVQFAIATERLYHEASSALDEYALYQRFIKPARGGGRRIQTKRAERALEGGGKYAVL